MPMETVQALGTAQTIENGLGARGIDWTSVTTGSGTTYSFPLYDAHGNQVATLARGSGSTYSLGNQRSFGAWGEIRQGATSGSPSGRYCGNLGHVQDDESGLIYMRARYYEPSSGRFASSDPSGEGRNWFAYCGNNPVSGVDSAGKFATMLTDVAAFITGMLALIAAWRASNLARPMILSGLAFLAAWCATDSLRELTGEGRKDAIMISGTLFIGVATLLLGDVQPIKGPQAEIASVIGAYIAFIGIFMAICDFEEGMPQ